MPSKSETVLQALVAALEVLVSAQRSVLRNEAFPTTVPPDGLVFIADDGEPGEPDELLGGEGPYVYQHEVPIEIIVQAGKRKELDAAFDVLKVAVGQALDADPTLGGTVTGMDYAAPAASDTAQDGAEPIKSGTITLRLEYESPTRI